MRDGGVLVAAGTRISLMDGSVVVEALGRDAKLMAPQQPINQAQSRIEVSSLADRTQLVGFSKFS
jgi:hypothetical protein